ncbi:Copper transport protein YcnJ precursor [compost metagenome]
MRFGWFKMSILIILVMLGLPSFVSAHANLERSTPLQDAQLKESPSEIRIQFTEGFDVKLSEISLENDKGTTIKGKLSSAKDRWLIYTIPKLDNGIYKVKWQVLSVDTHVTEGSFRFSIAVPLEKEKPSETVSLDGENLTPVSSTIAVPTPVVTLESKSESLKPVISPSQTPREVNPESTAPSINVDGVPALTPVPSPVANTKATNKPSSDADADSGKGQLTSQDQSTASNTLSSLTEAEDKTEVSSDSSGEESNAVITSESRNLPLVAPIETNSDAHDHGDHGGEHSLSDWRTSVYHLLRIIEVLIGISIAGFICFRYVIWGLNRMEAPSLFSKRNERYLYVLALVVFSISGTIHVWMLADQLSSMGTQSVLERSLTIVESTIVGKASWLRLALAGFLVALTYAPSHDKRWAFIFKGIAALSLLVLFPLTGHAYGSSSGVGVAIISHTLHMLAAAIWFGGLLGIWIVISKHNQTEQKYVEINRLVQRFSVMALPAIIVVAFSGIVLTLMRLQSWNALFHSQYGQLIIAKTIILIFIFVIAAFHRFVFMPRIQTMAGGECNPNLEVGLKLFVFGIRLEIILALATFVFAGMLSTTAPPETNRTTAEPSYWHVMGDKAHMSMRINPDESNGETFKLDVWLPTGMGAPATAQVELVQAKGDGVPVPIPITYVSGGPDPYGYQGFDKYTYEAKGNFLKETGEWNLSISITDSQNRIHPYEKSIRVY